MGATSTNQLGFLIFLLLFSWSADVGGGPPPRFYRKYSPVISFNLDETKVLNTSIRIAARENRLEDLKSSLNKKNADVNDQSDDGVSALMYAAWNCFPKIVDYLVQRGADVNLQDEQGRTALMYATRGLCLPVVKKLLITPSLLINTRDHRGRTILKYAQSAAALEVGDPADEILKLIRKKIQNFK